MTERDFNLQITVRNARLLRAIRDQYGTPADDLWPAHIARLKAKRARVELEMDAPEFAAISDSDPERQAIYRQAITRWSRHLSDREKMALSIRATGGLLEDIGDAMGGVTRERARQLVLRAERKMRKLARRDDVECMADLM